MSPWLRPEYVASLSHKDGRRPPSRAQQPNPSVQSTCSTMRRTTSPSPRGPSFLLPFTIGRIGTHVRILRCVAFVVDMRFAKVVVTSWGPIPSIHISASARALGWLRRITLAQRRRGFVAMRRRTCVRAARWETMQAAHVHPLLLRSHASHLCREEPQCAAFGRHSSRNRRVHVPPCPSNDARALPRLPCCSSSSSRDPCATSTSMPTSRNVHFVRSRP